MPHKTAKGKILLLGEDNRAYLSAARSLGRKNLEIHAAWGDFRNAEFSSRYVHKLHPIKAYSPSSDDWKQPFIELLKREKFDLVFPTSDQTIIPYMVHRRELESLAPVYLISDLAFEVTFNKLKTMELAQALGIPVPEWMLLPELADADGVVSFCGLPAVLKPLQSYSCENPGEKRFVKIAHHVEEIAEILPHMQFEGPLMAQKYVPGQGVGVELLAHDGKILVALQHVRLHEGAGGSTYRKSVPVQPHLLEVAQKFMAELRYTGVAMFEFRVDFATGRWVLLEVNGRLWGSLPLAVAAGADFPYYLYQMLTEGRVDFPQGYRFDIYARSFLKDLKWIVLTFQKLLRTPLQLAQFIWMMLKETSNTIALRERSDTFVLDDLRPGFIEVHHAIAEGAMKIGDKLRSLTLMLPKRKMAQREKARRALPRAKHLLFVSRGDTCRGPFAQQYARRVLAASRVVASAGYYPVRGRPSPLRAVQVARRWDIDITRHRSEVVTDEMVRGADVIFVFDQASRRRLLEQFEFAFGKIFLLGVLNSGRGIEISDPRGGSQSKCNRTYEQIVHAIDELARETQEVPSLP